MVHPIFTGALVAGGIALGLGGLCPLLPEPQGAWGVCRPDRDALRQRQHRPRAGHQQGRQPAAAIIPGRAGLVVAALPTRQQARGVVPQPDRVRGRPAAQGDDRGPGQEAARGVVALLPRRRPARGGGVEGRVETEEDLPLAWAAPSRTDPRSADRRRRPRTRSGAVTQNGAATLELPLPDARDRGHGSADPAGYEVGRASPVPHDTQLHLGSITREFPLDCRRLIRGLTHEISRLKTAFRRGASA